jgi:hypothetical protein
LKRREETKTENETKSSALEREIPPKLEIVDSVHVSLTTDSVFISISTSTGTIPGRPTTRRLDVSGVRANRIRQ